MISFVLTQIGLQPCRFCKIPSNLISTDYSIEENRKTPEMIEQKLLEAAKITLNGERDKYLKESGIHEESTPLHILNTLIIPNQVKGSFMYIYNLNYSYYYVNYI